MPLAVTLCRADIFKAHYSRDRTRTFFHSSSYTANPIACAAARANLELWQYGELRERVRSIANLQERAIAPLRTDSRFDNVRQTGTVTALELRSADSGYLASIGPSLQRLFSDRNLLLRPLGNTIYVMPPYCTTAADLDEIYAGIREAADLLA